MTGLPLRQLAPERADEVTLASACATRDRVALETFDRLLREEVGRVVRPIDAGAVDELTQAMKRAPVLTGVPRRIRPVLERGLSTDRGQRFPRWRRSSPRCNWHSAGPASRWRPTRFARGFP